MSKKVRIACCFYLLFEGYISNPTAGKNFEPNEEDLLHEVMLPIFDHKACDDIYNHILTRRMICAGYEFDKPPFKGPCMGDSGGPLICEGLLFGITSSNKINEPCGKSPAVFGRVKSIRKWITDWTGIKPYRDP